MTLPAYLVATGDVARPVQLSRAGLEEIRRAAAEEVTRQISRIPAPLSPPVVSLSSFGVTGDGSSTDGARIRRAIETAATDQLKLVLPAHPQFEGWRVDAAVTLEGKSGFVIEASRGAALSKRSGDFDLFTLTDCSNFRVNLPMHGRNSEAQFTLRRCTDFEMRRTTTTGMRGLRLFDGCKRGKFYGYESYDCTAAINIGEANMNGDSEPVEDMEFFNALLVGSRGEAVEHQNAQRGIWFWNAVMLDCNTEQNEEFVDLGGGYTSDIHYINPVLHASGKTGRTSTAYRGFLIKREYGRNPTNIYITNPDIYLNSANTESAGIAADQVDGLYIYGGTVRGDTARNMNFGGGTAYVGGMSLSGARGYCLRVASNGVVRGTSPITFAPGVGGGNTFAAPGSTLDLV